MVFFITAVSIFLFFQGYKKNKFFYFPVLSLLISNIIWGSYSYINTGKIAAGIKLVSFNSFVLNHAYDDEFTSIYPRLSPDTISSKIETKLPKSIDIFREASEQGALFGSVTSRDIIKTLKEFSDKEVKAKDVVLKQSIKNLGTFNVELILHPEVVGNLKINILNIEEKKK